VCEKCGTNFLKYINAVVATKKVAADAAHDRFERRSGLLTNVIALPFTWLSLIRYFFAGSSDRQ